MLASSLMSEKREQGPKQPEEQAPPYEPPAIIWEEPYEPIGFAVSCAENQGNPACLDPGIFN